MKHRMLIKGFVWIIIIMLFCSGIACKKAKSPETSLLGTWYYVNGNDNTTKIYVSFEQDGAMKIGMKGNNVSSLEKDWEEMFSGLFGDINDLLKKTGISIDFSAVDLSKTLSELFTITYEVKDDEEIKVTLTALKLVNIKHICQYNFKKNGDLVLNGMVFRKQ